MLWNTLNLAFGKCYKFLTPDMPCAHPLRLSIHRESPTQIGMQGATSGKYAFGKLSLVLLEEWVTQPKPRKRLRNFDA